MTQIKDVIQSFKPAVWHLGRSQKVKCIFFILAYVQIELKLNFSWSPILFTACNCKYFIKKKNLNLKLNPTILFTHLRIILLQYFQFSAISDIQIDPNVSLESTFCMFSNLHIFLVGSVHYPQNSQVLFSAKTTLKLSLITLFTYLKIILLQYFQ